MQYSSNRCMCHVYMRIDCIIKFQWFHLMSHSMHLRRSIGRYGLCVMIDDHHFCGVPMVEYKTLIVKNE